MFNNNCVLITNTCNAHKKNHLMVHIIKFTHVTVIKQILLLQSAFNVVVYLCLANDDKVKEEWVAKRKQKQYKTKGLFIKQKLKCRKKFKFY